MRCADAPRVIAARTLRLNTDHFAEAYIEGREFHIALLERMTGVELLPIAEILFEGLEAPAPKIYGYDAKWTPDSPAYIGTLRRFGLEHDEPELAKILQQFALACWNLFRFSGYARVDFRVDSAGAPFIIDVNPNPYLTPDTEDAAAAAKAGLTYQDLIGSIVESSLQVSQTTPSQLSRLETTPPRVQHLTARSWGSKFARCSLIEARLVLSEAFRIGASPAEWAHSRMLA